MLQTTSLDDGWQFMAKSWLQEPDYGYSKFEWLPARVPGHVHLDLVANGVIAHPFQRLQEIGARWVDEEDFVYRRSFDFEPTPDWPRALLVFRGLDGVCSVFLNDERLAQHDNMFIPLELDVSTRLRPGKNELRVEFQSAVRVGRERRAQFFSAEGLAEDVLRFDERAFVRKAQYMFGWDWGPRLVSCGLWGHVELVRCGSRLRDVHVTQVHLPDGSVELSFTSELDGPGYVLHEIAGIPGRYPDGSRIRIQHPQLWWPTGLGAQHLYSISSWLLPAPGLDGTLEDVALDRRAFKIGLRRVRLLQRSDAHGASFEFEINGRTLWALGANWIPDSSFPAEVDRQRVRAQVERARDMNMNMLRIWGGGLYESEDFYDACDELGILVWQDFPFACSYYPDDPASCLLVAREAEVNIKRLRNRASLALWCGNNENLTMWEDKWGDPKRHPPRYYGERIYADVLPRLLQELDPEHPYIPSSPYAGENGNGKANAGGSGDQHYWDVWHGRGDWKHYADSTGRFASEFGFAAAPSLESLQRMAPSSADLANLPVRDAVLRWHDKTSKGYETFIGYVELHYPVAQNAEEWAYYSQLNQRDALRFGIEHFRRSEYCKGSLIWQLNDCWPVQSWAVLDDGGKYKAAAYELRRLYAPALVSLELLDGQVRVWAVLDNASDPIREPLHVQLHSLLDGRTLYDSEYVLELAPGERRVVCTLPLDAHYDPRSCIVSARFQGRTTFRLLDEPKNVRLSAPRLNARFASGRLIIESDVPVVDLFLWDEQGSLELKDNFVTLTSGGSCVTLLTQGTPGRLRARSLQGHHTVRVSLPR